MQYKGIDLLEVDIHQGDPWRKNYVKSLNRLITEKLETAKQNRDAFMPPEKQLADPEYYRQEYLKTIGFPFEWVESGVPATEQTNMGWDDMAQYYRVTIEVMQGFAFWGILMLPHGISEPRPLVIAQHGGGGTPELCADLSGENNYGFFVRRALARGCVVFAPSLLLWCYNEALPPEEALFDFPSNREQFDAKLRRLGYSITGFEILCIRRAIDYLVTRKEVAPDRIGMMGLSYGGYFSLHTAAADTRIKSVYDAASFNDRDAIAFPDWSYMDAARRFSDAEVAGLICPRALRIDVGKTDTVFDYTPAPAEAERAKRYFAAANAGDKFSFSLWEGGHYFDDSLEGFDFFFRNLE